MALVSVHKVSEAFGVSARTVQQLVLRGMPREAHGEYDLTKCMLWYARYLHSRACGCAGPCEGFERRGLTNIRAARQRVHKALAEVASELAVADRARLERLLTEAVEGAFRPIEELERRAVERD
jgi:phage terminase Nu1 subunit (DNA packaging protein)